MAYNFSKDSQGGFTDVRWMVTLLFAIIFGTIAVANRWWPYLFPASAFTLLFVADLYPPIGALVWPPLAAAADWVKAQVGKL